MVRSILVFLLICVCSSATSAYGQNQNNQQSVEMKGRKNNGHGRGELVLPVVVYSINENTLSIEFESEDSYVLEIEDTIGFTWYSGVLNTSGIPTVYYVNLQTANTYIISISSSNDLFYGILEL